MSQKILVLLSLCITLGLTACTKATPEHMAESTSYSSLPVLFFVLSVAAIFGILGFAFIYILKKPNTNQKLWMTIITLISLTIMNGAMFPLNIMKMLENSITNGFTIIFWLYALYSVCGYIKTACNKKITGFALFFGSAVTGMIARFILEFGEVSNTENFTLPNILWFLGIYTVIYLLSSKKRKVF